MPESRGPIRSTRKHAIRVLTAGVLVAMAGLRVADLRSARAETLQVAESRAANLALILSAYLGEAFAAGDASLRQLALHSRRISGAAAPDEDWAPTLASARAGLTGIGSISIVDREGVIRHSTRPEIVGQSRRDDYLFRQAIAARDDNLVVGTPFRAVIPPYGLLIPIGRRLVRPDGTIDGAVVASFSPAEARAFLRTVDVGTRGLVWVFHPDGLVLFREPSTTAALGESARDNPIFAAASRTGGGIVREPLERDGPVLLTAFTAARTSPLIVAVSLDRDEVLADWRREATIAAIVFAVLAVALVLATMLLSRQIDAKASAERALREAERREAERLRDVNQRLEATLEREQSARSEAEAASALKDQFLMTVSHELRTPLTAIAGWARMLVDGAVHEDRRDDALRTIARNADAQTHLVDDLLDGAAVTTGKLRLDVRSVEMADVVRDAIETIRPAAHAKRIRIEPVLDGGSAQVAGDPERLRQIVWNLLSNAVKFTPNGGHVRVAVSREGDEIVVVVADNGLGITPDFLPHVFERFRQQHAGTTRRFGGLGIGLAIVRSLVELHGGSVTAESAGEGRGATFRVRLPTEQPVIRGYSDPGVYLADSAPPADVSQSNRD